MKVLIVDEARASLKLLRAVLEAEEVGVVEAADGLQALALLGRQTVDAIISDILMPRVDNYRFRQTGLEERRASSAGKRCQESPDHSPFGREDGPVD
jgi:CheY-like chemotaxis protein